VLQRRDSGGGSVTGRRFGSLRGLDKLRKDSAFTSDDRSRETAGLTQMDLAGAAGSGGGRGSVSSSSGAGAGGDANITADDVSFSQVRTQPRGVYGVPLCLSVCLSLSMCVCVGVAHGRISISATLN
jgi:hypothetical protein